MISLPALEDRLHAITRIIDDARADADQGRIMELGDVKAETERLCAAILKLPPAEARSLQPLIGDLITRLDDLERILTNIRQKAES